MSLITYLNIKNMEVKNKYSQNMRDDYYSWEKRHHVQIKKASFFQSYDIYLCDEILKKHLPKATSDQKLKIVELWSGDGKMLKKLWKMFNYDPIGLEYSPEWVKMWLNNWVETKLCDVFDENDIQPYLNSFDVVFSYGFIEHIIPVEKAIIQHLKLLKPGGYLILQIPRIKGFNYRKFKFFRPDLIPLHNLELMEDYILSKHCKGFPELKEIFCKNYGTFKIRVPLLKQWWKYYLGKIIAYLEYITNPLLRFLFGKKWCESRFFSPSIIYIWKKNK